MNQHAMADKEVSSNSQKSLFQCGTCSQSYSRIDHLSRHVRSHTQEKPYQCHICEKKFGRIDLLTRHTSLHNPENERSSRKRRRDGENGTVAVRTAQACVACAENHLRCDDKKPCDRCQRKAIECKVPPRVGEDPGIYQKPPRIESHDSNTSSLSQGGGTHLQFQAASEDPRWVSPDLSDRSHQVSETVPLTQADLPDSSVLHHPGTLLAPEPNDFFLGTFNSMCPSGIRTPRSLITFGLETDLDLSMVDLSFLESYNSRNPFEFEEQTVMPLPVPIETTAPNIDIGTDFPAAKDATSLQKLIWRFIPAPQDHGFAEHNNLLLPDQPEQNTTPQSLVEFDRRTTAEKLDLVSRDKILSIFLSQLKQPTTPQPVSFPSVDLLDGLIQYYLTAPFSTASSWLHIPTFTPKRTCPELLLALAAAGAVLIPDPSLRKLGYAMQEVVRLQLATVFEGNNTKIRDLEIHQTYFLQLHIGMWSGNSRKIEISESFQQPLVTMLRRGGMFHESAYPLFNAPIEQTGRLLEEQWAIWVRQESFRRLVYQLFRHDSQASMALLISPLISYTELCIPLPSSDALWNATSAVEWRDVYCKELASTKSSRVPTLIECVANIDLLDMNRRSIDLKLSCEIVAYALWGIFWEFRRFSQLLKQNARYWDSGLVIGSRHQELTRILDYFRIAYEDQTALILHVILLNMHVSMEDVQLLATLESEANHQVRPALRQWTCQKEARIALWHAGQIVRQARLLPSKGLRDFTAVALYHAALTIWAYGIARQEPPRMSNQSQNFHNHHPQQQQQQMPALQTPQSQQDISQEIIEDSESTKVWLDDVQADDVKRYIAFERGIPVLQSVKAECRPVYIHSPWSILDLVIDLMDHNYRRKPVQRPHLVANLINLLEKLRDATQAG